MNNEQVPEETMNKEQVQRQPEEPINMIVITTEQTENETHLQSSTLAKKKAQKGRIQNGDQNGVALELKFQNNNESSRKNNAWIEDSDKRLDSRRLQNIWNESFTVQIERVHW